MKKKIISMMLSLVMLLSMSLFSFGANVVKNLPQPLKMKQTVTIKNLKTKEGTWKSVELTMYDVKHISSNDPNMNAFAVEMYVTLDTFTGSKKAILSHNFPVVFIGDRNYKVDFDDLDTPLLGYTGICKLNLPYKGENFELPPKNYGSVNRIGSFNIMVPKNKESIVFPVIYSNGSKTEFEFNQKSLTDLSKFLLKAEATYGSKQDGEFKTSLDFINDLTYSETKYSKKYVLNKTTEQDSFEVITSIVGDAYNLNSETLNKTVKEKADDLKYKMTQLDNNIFMLEGYKFKDLYECVVYYGCDNYFRKLEILSSIKFQDRVQEVITSFNFDNSSVVIEKPRFLKAKQVNGLYAGTGKTTQFNSPVQLYCDINSRNPLAAVDFSSNNKEVDDTKIKYETADGNLMITQSVSGQHSTLSRFSKSILEILNEGKHDNKYFELVKDELGIFVSNQAEGTVEYCVIKYSKNKIEIIDILCKEKSYTEVAKILLKSFFNQFQYDPELVNKVFN